MRAAIAVALEATNCYSSPIWRAFLALKASQSRTSSMRQPVTGGKSRAVGGMAAKLGPPRPRWRRRCARKVASRRSRLTPSAAHSSHNLRALSMTVTLSAGARIHPRPMPDIIPLSTYKRAPWRWG